MLIGYLRGGGKKIGHCRQDYISRHFNSGFIGADSRAGRQRKGSHLSDGVANENKISVLFFEDLRARTSVYTLLAIILA
jgi:hypothetical protein